MLKHENKVDFKRLKQARENFLHNQSLQTFINDFELDQKIENAEIKDYVLKIQKIFFNEIQKLSLIFKLLNDVRIDNELFADLYQICKMLNIDSKKLELFYKFKAEQLKELFRKKMKEMYLWRKVIRLY